LTSHEPRRLLEMEEVVGDIHRVENTEFGLVATIGRISVLLPEELAGKLQEMMGQRIGVLRLDGYHVRLDCETRQRVQTSRGL